MRISDWSSDVCSSDLPDRIAFAQRLVDIAGPGTARHELDVELDHLPSRRCAGDRKGARSYGPGQSEVDILTCLEVDGLPQVDPKSLDGRGQAFDSRHPSGEIADRDDFRIGILVDVRLDREIGRAHV